MKQTMTIYKEQAIEAIVHEPVLKSGEFFNTNKPLKYCEVCAVGSVLREHCFTTRFEGPYGASNKAFRLCEYRAAAHEFDNKFMYGSAGHLSNLSMAFEHLCNELLANSNEMKMNLISVIEASWPESFEISWEQ